MLAQIKQRHSEAAARLAKQTQWAPASAATVVDHLSADLTNLRNLLLRRVHEDVQTEFGLDSMLSPMTASEEERELRNAKVEIEIYSAVVAANEIAAGGYVDDEAWAIDWLMHLRFGDDIPEGLQHRLDGYRKRSRESRRLLFSDLLVRSLPEAHKAPLIIFRLFPRAVRLAVAVTFNDPVRAARWRDEQTAMLPAVGDCLQCHGRPLESGDVCDECGNPLWKLPWLRAAD